MATDHLAMRSDHIYEGMDTLNLNPNGTPDTLISATVKTVYGNWVEVLQVRGNIVITNRGCYHITKLLTSTAYR